MRRHGRSENIRGECNATSAPRERRRSTHRSTITMGQPARQPHYRLVLPFSATKARLRPSRIVWEESPRRECLENALAPPRAPTSCAIRTSRGPFRPHRSLDERRIVWIHSMSVRCARRVPWCVAGRPQALVHQVLCQCAPGVIGRNERPFVGAFAGREIPFAVDQEVSIAAKLVEVFRVGSAFHGCAASRNRPECNSAFDRVSSANNSLCGRSQNDGSK